MRSYSIIDDYTNSPNEIDQLSFDAGCVIAVFRHRYPTTFSRENGDSFSKDANKAVELIASPLIIVDGVQSVATSSTKSSHISQLNCALKPNMNYLAEILPGDYLFCWMTQRQSEIDSLIDRLNKGEACNRFNDGLKFYGKVASVRKAFSTAPNGMQAVGYSVAAGGFTELDGSIYYDPHLALKQFGIATSLLNNFSLNINQLVDKKTGFISINKAIPSILHAFFDTGLPKDANIKDSPLRTTYGADNGHSFAVPQQVASVFGIKKESNPRYSDLLRIVHGIQKYTRDLSGSLGKTVFDKSATDNDILAETERVGDIFTPAFQTLDTTLYTGVDQLGDFAPNIPAANGNMTVWSLINQYNNDALNENYTTLRTDYFGNIYPTFITRQLPFSSGVISEKYTPKAFKDALRRTLENPPPKKQIQVKIKQGFQGLPSNVTTTTYKTETVADFESVMESVERLTTQDEAGNMKLKTRNVTVTRFAELPRWIIHPTLITSFNLGRSDAMRFNFVGLGAEPGMQTGTDPVGVFAENLPIVDNLDAMRSGLRPYIRTVPCNVNERQSVSDWMYILSDILMGQHLTLTGNIECHGIQQPICIGDNIEFDNVILHIESVTHTFQIAQNGMKSFRTSLSLTHGVNATQLEGEDSTLYSGIKQTDLTALDPGITNESIYSSESHLDSEDRVGVKESNSPLK